MPVAKVGDINIEYYVEGTGPPLLMIIGLGAHAGTWGQPFLEPLRPHFQTIRFSHYGTGLSDNPSGEATMGTMADDAVALLRELGIEKAHVLGISMGGNVAQELVLNYPEMVQGLVLGCTNCGVPHSVPQTAETMARLAQMASLPEKERVRQFCLALVSPEFGETGKEFMDEMTEAHLSTSMETFGRQMMAIQAFDCYARLRQIQTPTLIIHGDRDIIIPTENAEVLRERIASSKVQIISSVGHMFIWERPEESAEAIVEFLASVPQPA